MLGIGNILLCDDGAGVHAVRALRNGCRFPADVELIDGGTMGLDLLPLIEGSDRLLIVDAVCLNGPPGEIKVIDGGRIKTFLDAKLSAHQIGIKDALFAARLRGTMPPEVCLVGIEPERIEAGLELSETLRGKLDAFVNAIINKLKEWGIQVNVSCNTVKDNQD